MFGKKENELKPEVYKKNEYVGELMSDFLDRLAYEINADKNVAIAYRNLLACSDDILSVASETDVTGNKNRAFVKLFEELSKETNRDFVLSALGRIIGFSCTGKSDYEMILDQMSFAASVVGRSYDAKRVEIARRNLEMYPELVIYRAMEILPRNLGKGK